MRTFEFKREHRYCVLKVKDIHEFLTDEQQDDLDDICRTINHGRLLKNREILDGVFVESDWPEAEAVWAMIEARTRRDKHED